MLIYLISNTVNGKTYVGQTVKRLKKRWIEHLCAARTGSKLPLHCAIRKYGDQAFEVKELARATSFEELSALEQEWIARTDSFKRGYNCTVGGEGSHGFKHSPEALAKMKARVGWKHTPEARARISEAGRGRKMTEHNRERLRAAHTGRKMTENEKAALRASHLGQKMPESTRNKIRQAILGIKRRPESIEKTRRANIGKIVSPETRAKIGNANRGRRWKRKTPLPPISEETRQKLRMTSLGRRHSPETIEKCKAAKLAWWANKTVNQLSSST